MCFKISVVLSVRSQRLCNCNCLQVIIVLIVNCAPFKDLYQLDTFNLANILANASIFLTVACIDARTVTWRRPQESNKLVFMGYEPIVIYRYPFHSAAI